MLGVRVPSASPLANLPGDASTRRPALLPDRRILPLSPDARMRPALRETWDMRRVRPALAILLAPLLALSLLLGAPAGAVAGDSVVAGALLAQGKKALSSRKFEDAVALFHKAWTEDPNLAEAVYWKAQALEKMKNASAALVAYRDFLALVEKKKAAGRA